MNSVMEEEDTLLAELAAACPGQTDAVAQSLRAVVRRTLGGTTHEPFRLGRFTVLEVLGRGGMGTVFVAYDPDLDRKIALKVLRTTGERGRANVLREGRALARLKHPGVVTVYEVGVVGDQVFVAMEYVAGSNLRVWLRQHRPPTAQLLALLVEAGRGIAAAHDADLVHLDIKPENLIVAADGHARVIDFGLARPLEDAQTTLDGSGSSSSGASTTQGGTPGYIAPERLGGARGDPRADQFSFCVTCWEALFGQRPRAGEEPASTRTGVPPRVVRALRRGLSPAPDDRFPSMHALLAELAVRPRRTWFVSLALAAALGLALGGYAIGQLGQAMAPCSPPREQIAGLWNAERADAIAAAFAASGAPFAGDTWATVRSGLDRYAEAWGAAHVRACEQTHVTGVASLETFGRRGLCLADRRLHFTALLDRFTAADRDTVTRAHAAVESLPPIADCEQTDPGELGPPVEARRLTEFMALRDEYARVRAEVETGRLGVMAPQIERLIARARADNNHSLLIDALLLGARVDRSAERAERGVARSQEALALALRHAEPVKAARAALHLTDSLRQLHPDAPVHEDLLAIADALCRQAGDPPQLQVQVMIERGRELQNAKRCREALPHLEAAREYALAHDLPDLAATALMNIGICRDATGDYAGSIAADRQALAETEALVGAMHPRLADLHNNIAAAMLTTDQPESAVAHLERSAAIYRANFGELHGSLGTVQVNIASVHHAMGRYEESLAAFRQAAAIFEQVGGPKAGYAALSWCAGGLPLRALGRFEEGLRETQRGLDMPQVGLPRGRCDWLACTALHAEFLHELGRHAEALAELEPALAFAEKSTCPKEQRGDLELTAARALWALRGKQARARILALLDAMSPLSDAKAVARAEQLRAELR